MRNYGIIQSSRASLGGMSTDAAATHGKYAPRDSNIIRFPSGSILADPVRPTLERGRFSQAALDILAVGSFALLVCSSASAVGIIAYVFKLRFFS